MERTWAAGMGCLLVCKMRKQFFVDKGREGANKRWDKAKEARKELLQEVSKFVTDKPILNLIQSKLKNEDIEKLLRYWKTKHG